MYVCLYACMHVRLRWCSMNLEHHIMSIIDQGGQVYIFNLIDTWWMQWYQWPILSCPSNPTWIVSKGRHFIAPPKMSRRRHPGFSAKKMWKCIMETFLERLHDLLYDPCPDPFAPCNVTWWDYSKSWLCMYVLWGIASVCMNERDTSKLSKFQTNSFFNHLISKSVFSLLNC